MHQIGFVLEQALGHLTHSKNLQSHAQLDPEIHAHWALVEFEAEGLSQRIPIYNSNWSVRAGLRAHRLLSNIARATTLDALFFHTQVPAVLAQHWLRRIPSIVSLDATPMQYDQLGEFYQHRTGAPSIESIKWRLNRDCYRAAKRLVVWAEWTKHSLVTDYGIDKGKIIVVPPGVTVREWLRPKPRSPLDGAIKILFVGGDLERKGGRLLIEAFRALRRPQLELHLVTKTVVPNEPGIFVHSNMAPNSRELIELYHQCDIFALPTFGDCLPMVLSEAGAAGLATVSTNLAGIPEIVQDRRTGLLVPPGDPAALTETLRTLLDNPELRIELGARAVQHVSNSYDAEKNAIRLFDLLKSVSSKQNRTEH